MKESDWKKFKRIKEKAIERFCGQALEEFEKLISDRELGVHERYLRLYKQVRDRNKEMSRIFDGHSRSHAPLQLTLIRSRELAPEALLAELSDELLEQTKPNLFGRD